MAGPDRFPSTRHSLLEAAGGRREGVAREALDGVIAAYWQPVSKYIQWKWRKTGDEAADLTQAFFTALLERDTLAKFDAGRGMFRTYLRACVDSFVLHANEADGRLKRGGGQAMVELDDGHASGEPSPEEYFYREWQRQIFALAVEDLRARCAAEGKQTQFRIFEQYDLAEGDRPRYGDLAAEHGVAATAVTNYLAWARGELRKLVLARLERVTAGNEEFRSEARRLFQ